MKFRLFKLSVWAKNFIESVIEDDDSRIRHRNIVFVIFGLSTLLNLYILIMVNVWIGVLWYLSGAVQCFLMIVISDYISREVEKESTLKDFIPMHKDMPYALFFYTTGLCFSVFAVVILLAAYRDVEQKKEESDLAYRRKKKISRLEL
jgi:hypothetical protein